MPGHHMDCMNGTQLVVQDYEEKHIILFVDVLHREIFIRMHMKRPFLFLFTCRN